jgi:nicotinamidase/pyrazinamidase
MTAALVIVDVQVDFCAGGSLPVPDAEAILPVVNRLLGEFDRVILTQDWHPPGHVSFASSHPGKQPFSRIMLPSGEQMLWPDHCVAGSAGARLHPGLEIPPSTPVGWATP